MTPSDISKQDKQNKSFSLLWQLRGLGPQRHLWLSYTEGRGRETTPGIPKISFCCFNWSSSSLFMLACCFYHLLEGETLDDLEMWYVEEAPAAESQQRLRGSLMWTQTSVLIQSWRSLWIMNELARLTWFPHHLFALRLQVLGGGETTRSLKRKWRCLTWGPRPLLDIFLSRLTQIRRFMTKIDRLWTLKRFHQRLILLVHWYPFAHACFDQSLCAPVFAPPGCIYF